MKSEQTTRILNSNYFEFTGKVTYVDVKYAQSGGAYTRVLISKKNAKNDKEYDTYAFMFFGETAEDFAEKIKKGDTVNIVGVISVNKYTKDGKTTEKYELIGRHFVKAEYDETRKGYVTAPGDKLPWA